MYGLLLVLGQTALLSMKSDNTYAQSLVYRGAIIMADDLCWENSVDSRKVVNIM